MRKYETVFISDPDIQDQTRTDLFDKVRNIIAKENGYLIDFDDWGSKKLSYEIKKKLRGHYVCTTYGGSGELVKELERNLRLSDDVMKFMTILLSDNVTLEQLEKEAEEAKNKPKKSDETDVVSEKEEGLAEDDASDEDEDDTETEEEIE
ncbi:MAG: 30S ribosomal protein S6 [Desulfobacula sp.]|jgi:small subunit ribosomal protein S6